MMSSSVSYLDYWRDYFKCVKSDIFDIIDGAIMVAESDRPEEFRLRRCAIAKRLFSSQGSFSALSMDNNEFKVLPMASKESNVMNNISDAEVEALNDEINQESQCIKEILRIRDILRNSKQQSHSVLFESLKKLQPMRLTVDLLEETKIGKVVKPLKKHRSKDISQVAKTLIKDWIEIMDEWIKATTTPNATENNTLDSTNPSIVNEEEEGLPLPPMDEHALFTTHMVSMDLSRFFDGVDDNESELSLQKDPDDSINPCVMDDEEDGLPLPPMDEGALFTTHMVSMDFSHFFDDVDDDGNLLQSGEFIQTREDDKRSCLNNQNIAKTKSEAHIVAKDSKSGQEKKNEALVVMQKKDNLESKIQQQNMMKGVITKKPTQVSQLDKYKCLDDAALQVKFEATKRKLKEQYQQDKNAKKQRIVQVIELHDLPKQNPLVKPRNLHKRKWANGRR